MGFDIVLSKLNEGYIFIHVQVNILRYVTSGNLCMRICIHTSTENKKTSNYKPINIVQKCNIAYRPIMKECEDI